MNPTVASRILMPSASAEDPLRRDERLADTGTTEAHNELPCLTNSMYVLLVGATAVRVEFHALPGQSDVVATTSKLYPAYAQVTWTVEPGTRHVYIEAGDGTSAYEAWVWKAS